jgi:phosphoglucosamine mutase
MARTGKTLNELTSIMTVFPQIMINVRGVDHHSLTGNAGIAAAVEAAEAELGETGRVLLRPSGTEPMVRVMVEAADQSTADRIAHELAEVVRTELAL